MNLPKESLFALGFLIIFLFTMILFVVSQREDYCKRLIDFGHARYIINPATGESKFEIDPVPAKTNSK